MLGTRVDINEGTGSEVSTWTSSSNHAVAGRAVTQAPPKDAQAKGSPVTGSARLYRLDLEQTSDNLGAPD